MQEYEKEFNKIFAERLKFFLDKYDMTRIDLSKRLGVSPQSVTNWCNALKSPRMDKVDAMCEIFHCKRSDLMEDKTPEEDNSEYLPYYLDEDAREMAEFMYHNPEYKVLFDASRKVSREDIDFVKQMLDRFKSDDSGC